MKKNLKDKKSLNIAMLGHKRIPSREGGIEIVVEELSTRMVTLGHKVTCYNRSGHHVSGKDFDGGKRKAYKGVRLKSVLTLDKKGLAAMTASVSGAICAAFGKYDVVHFHGQFDLSSVGLSEEEIKDISQIYIVACGSAYHVGIAAQYVIEDLAKIPVRVELGSEFRYRNPLLDPKGLVIVISQSGETADSLAALRESKEKGVRTMAIVNVVGSSIAREADSVFYTLAGPEIAVATTKAYSTQLMATYVLALQFAKVRGEISDETYKNMIAELQTIPDKIAKILEDKERIQWFASKQANAHDVFFVGRGIDYAICMEGSLKMKEISYIHSEAYAAGELKHGTISLIEDDILVVGVLTQPDLYEKTISNMVECRSRGAYLMGLTTFGQYNIEDSTDFAVYIPKIDPHFATSLAVIPLQLLGYYISVAKGLDVDKPRNLAKSVTVE